MVICPPIKLRTVLNFFSFQQNKISKKLAGLTEVFDFGHVEKIHFEKIPVHVQSNR